MCWKTMENNKTPEWNGLTVEFYGYFWNIIAKYIIESFNYAFESGNLSYFPKIRNNFSDTKEKEKYQILKKLAPSFIAKCGLWDRY